MIRIHWANQKLLQLQVHLWEVKYNAIDSDFIMMKGLDNQLRSLC